MSEVVNLKSETERAALLALREALKHLTAAQVIFDAGGWGLFKITDVAVHADGVDDAGTITVHLEKL